MSSYPPPPDWDTLGEAIEQREAALADVAHLRRQVERLARDIDDAHAALDKAVIGREHVETDGDFGEVIVERRTLTLAERVGHLDTDRQIAWDAHADAMAVVKRLTPVVERLTRERDAALADAAKGFV